MKVVLASHNQKKMVEMKAILSQMGVEVLSQAEVGMDLEPEETGTTFEENARIKAQAVMQATGLPAIADDSGLMVDALGGDPGAGRHGPVAAPAEKHGRGEQPGLQVRQRHLLRLPRRGRGDGPGGVPRHPGPGAQRGRGLWL